MGFMDKLKNIFFEEEDDEEDEIEEALPPKKEKNDDNPKKIEKTKEVIAKKVEIPKIRKEEHNVVVEEPKEKKIEIKPKINTELIFDDEDFILDTKPKVKKEENTNLYMNTKKTDPELYKTKETRVVKEKKEKVDDHISNTIYSSEPKQITKSFKPSPIISPIYGILDKNYKKEEVKENKEIILSTRPSRIDVDSVRNKAFGDLEYDLFEDTVDEKQDKESIEQKLENNDEKREKNKRNLKKIYDTKEDNKPKLDKVTIGEADEYFNDLGLAYNTDYKDLSKDLNDGKVEVKDKSDKLEDNLFDLIESMYDRED